MARQAQCHRVRSVVTPKVNVIKAKNVNVHAELPKLTSGQLPFLGLIVAGGIQPREQHLGKTELLQALIA